GRIAVDIWVGVCVGSRRAPSSTLFPYTTLFRSQHGHEHPRDARAHGVAGGLRVVHPVQREDEQRRREDGSELVDGVRHCFLNILDRKSTRLNSSHVAISYAVFCLIK